MREIDGKIFIRMVASGAQSLKAHVREVNELNVFPIPDGDTGDNMLMTIMGGARIKGEGLECLSLAAERVSGGMLLSARGNSGVILSQFFEGIKNGLSGLDTANAEELGYAFREGVRQAYSSVMTPTEGTILTVIREASDYAAERKPEQAEELLSGFIEEARRSLERTPELLPVLKKAGVVDSGAAGLIYIAEGMLRGLSGEEPEELEPSEHGTGELDLDAFGEDSVLEFGYCTELLLRLQSFKTDIPSFDVRIISDYLGTVGDSIVAVKNGSIVKIHVHTVTPHKVLAFCQQYGEFLKVKIENMSLQHNNTVADVSDGEQTPRERKKYGIVAVASGEGLKQAFLDRGVDVIVDGGQSMNPSAEELMRAFDAAMADTVLVFPNNSNIVLTAKQAAALYTKSDVRVIESRTIGAGYAALSMYDESIGDTDAIVEELNFAMEDVVTAEISHCVRDAEMDGVKMKKGDYIGFVGKHLLGVSADRYGAVIETVDKAGLKEHDICILIRGKDADEAEAERIAEYISREYRGKELYIINGGQDVYDYILIIE